MPALTRDTHIVVAGPAWAAELDEDYNDATVATSSNLAAAPAKASRWTPKFITQIDESISVGTLYQGPSTDAMRSAGGEGAAFLMLDAYDGAAPAWVGGPAVWPSMAESAQVNDPIVNNVGMMPSSVWARGFSCGRFELSSGAGEFAIPGTFANDDECYLVVVKQSSSSQQVKITDGSKSVTATFKGPGYQKINLGSLASSIAAGKVTATLSSNNTLTGYVFVGELTSI